MYAEHLTAFEANSAVFHAVLCALTNCSSTTVSIPRIADDIVTAVAVHQAVLHTSTQSTICTSKDAITAERIVALLIHLADAPVVLEILTLLTLKPKSEVVIPCCGEDLLRADDAAVPQQLFCVIRDSRLRRQPHPQLGYSDGDYVQVVHPLRREER
jgi:hypothetical protein